MKTRAPTSKEIGELVAFLPRLYAEGFTPIKRWIGGTKGKDGVITIPTPEYDEVVLEFIRVASSDFWRNYDYLGEARRLLDNDDLIRNADLDQIKAMLTYCVRGERFCDGHWGAMIESGKVRRLLQRLSELQS